MLEVLITWCSNIYPHVSSETLGTMLSYEKHVMYVMPCSLFQSQFYESGSYRGQAVLELILYLTRIFNL